jgi:hypothetical protein
MPLAIYNYHPDHGAFVSVDEADPDPMVEGDYIIPANATAVEPPEMTTDGYVQCWRDGAWVEIEDHRGELWWTPTGDPVTISKPGNPADDGLLPEEPVPVHQRFAFVKEGLVLQVLAWNTSGMVWQSMPDCRMVDDANAEAQPGGSFDGSTFHPPPAPRSGDDDVAA